jgi:hypothetical protein
MQMKFCPIWGAIFVVADTYASGNGCGRRRCEPVRVLMLRLVLQPRSLPIAGYLKIASQIILSNWLSGTFKYMVRSFIVCTLLQILLGKSNECSISNVSRISFFETGGGTTRGLEKH